MKEIIKEELGNFVRYFIKAMTPTIIIAAMVLIFMGTITLVHQIYLYDTHMTYPSASSGCYKHGFNCPEKLKSK